MHARVAVASLVVTILLGLLTVVVIRPQAGGGKGIAGTLAPQTDPFSTGTDQPQGAAPPSPKEAQGRSVTIDRPMGAREAVQTPAPAPGGTKVDAGPSGPLLSSLNPMQLASIWIDTHDGMVHELRASPQSETWILTRSGRDAQGHDDAWSWPVELARVRGLQRLLGELAKAPLLDTDAAQGAGPPRDAITVLIHPARLGEARVARDASRPIELRVARDALGGATMVWESTRTADTRQVWRARRAESSWSDLLLPDALAAWRSSRVFQLPPAGPTRIEIVAQGRRLDLRRIRGNWGMIAPVEGPVAQDAAQALVARVASLSASRLLTASALGAPPQASPTAVVRVFSPGNAGSADTQHTLFVGDLADAEGASFHGEVVVAGAEPGAGWGPQGLTVSREALEGLAPGDPLALLSRISVQAAAGDVGGALISPDDELLRLATPPPPHDLARPPVAMPGKVALTRIVRREGRWTLARDATSEGTALEEQGSGMMDRIAALLCDTPAVRTLGGPLDPAAQEAMTPLAHITLLGAGGGAMDTMAFGVLTSRAQGQATPTGVVVRVGQIFRVYEGEDTVEIAAWVQSLLVAPKP